MHDGQILSALIKQGFHSSEDPSLCACHGGGWVLSPFDVWVKCPCHDGVHPEEDYPEGAEDEEYIIPAVVSDDSPF